MNPNAADRREFALALAAATLAAGAAEADEAPKAANAENGIVAVLRDRYGKHLTEEQWQAVRQRVRAALSRAAQLRKLPLPNSADPALAFRADLP